MRKAKVLSGVEMLIMAILSLFTPNVYPHPVTYEDGYAVMNWYHPQANDLHVQYSLSPKLAVALGYTSIEDQDRDRHEFILPRVNTRLWRRNAPAWQGNLYLSLGAGSRVDGKQEEFAGVFALQGDLESRRYYTLLNAEEIQSAGENDFLRASYRLGVAPYLAEYDGLQTFLIGEVSYTPEMEDTWSAGPLLRFFYRFVLVEIGVHSDGDVMGTFMLHY